MTDRLSFFPAILLLALLTTSVHAAIEKPDFVPLKAKLEQSLTKKYTERLSQRLTADMFAISVSVTLNPSSETIRSQSVSSALLLVESHKMSSKLPTGDLYNLQKIHKSIGAIELSVALSPKLGPEYKETFRTWLTKNAAAEFGVLAKVKVLELQPTPVSQLTLFNLPPAENVATVLIGLSLLASAFGIRYMMGRAPARTPIVYSQLTSFIRAQMSRVKKTELVSAMPVAITTEQPEAVAAPTILDKIEEEFSHRQRKVALIVLSMESRFGVAIDQWLSEGVDGQRKLATVVDSVFTQQSSAQFTENDSEAKPEKNPDWTVPERIKKDRALLAVCRSFGALVPTAVKTELIARAYWDLMSIQSEDTSVTVQPELLPVAQATELFGPPPNQMPTFAQTVRDKDAAA